MDTFEFTVAHDLCIGIIDLQASEQGDKGCTLRWRTSVSRTTSFVETTFVTDADGMGIVVAGMSTDHLFGTALMELTITSNIIVVATAVPSFGSVHLVKHLERQMLVRPRSRTVNYYKIYSSHLS